MSETKEVATLTDSANLAMTARAREASALAKSDLVPAAYRDNPANVMVAMELAHRIGASVMAVMQNLFVIQGKPSFSSTFLIATVNACGRFSPLRFRFDGEGDEYGCRAVATDLKTAEECIGPKITNRMVDAEGWRKKNGSKWLTMPELMFQYRAAAFWTRIYAPELSLGMHSTDEIEDIQVQRIERDPDAPARTRPAILDVIAAPRSATAEEVETAEAAADAKPVGAI